jgi:predicted ATPase/class 3 adenylate cyclase
MKVRHACDEGCVDRPLCARWRMIIGVPRDLPAGTVTFLFTDVEGSTRLLHEFGADQYARALAEHRRILRETFSTHGGAEVDTQGDAFFVAFPSAPAAVRAAAQAVEELSSGPIQVRIGIHTGTPHLGEEGYVGVDVHRAARIGAAGHGGQVLVSASTAALLDGDELLDLGEHRLKDLTQPERLYQLVIPGLQAEFPALKTLENHPTNLPTQPTLLIGREQELVHTADLLRRAEVRLLTLTGAGGTGKTRLALQLAADLLEEFPDGVFFVSLAAIRDPSLVVATVAQTLAVSQLPGRSLEETLVQHLRERRLLLLLDNLEQLLAGAPSLAALLAAAPHLKMLVTSRAPLRLAAEQEYAVQPLGLPDAKRLPELPALSQYEAIALFIDRARAVRPDFKLTIQNAPAVAEICVRLDGLPLAIELAAARVRAMTPQALRPRLEQRLKLLTGGPRDASTRQQTLRGAIDWSYTLLSEPQQRLLSRLSVFVGGCDLEAAEAVCGLDGRLGLDVLESISSLIENSLLGKRDDPGGQPRYWMLETIREYAGERLEASGETEALRRRHAGYFLALAERAERSVHFAVPTGRVKRNMTGQEIRVADVSEERLAREVPNLRAALQWTFDEGDLELALRLAAAAALGWAVSSSYTEGRAWVARALDETEHLQTVERARALLWLAIFAAFEGDFRSAQALNERASTLFEQHHDQLGVFRSLMTLTSFATSVGDLERARVVLEEASTLADDLASDHERVWLCFKAALVESLAGDYEQALVVIEEGLELCRKLGVPRRQWVHQLINVGSFALAQHDFARARAALQEYLAEDSGKTPLGIATAQVNLGEVALHEGDGEDAAQRFRQALALARDAGAKPTIAGAVYGLAAVAAIDGDAERSARLWGAADAIKKSTGSRSTDEQFIVERYLESAGGTLAEDVHRAARAEGGSMSLDEALAYALEQLNSAPGS